MKAPSQKHGLKVFSGAGQYPLLAMVPRFLVHNCFAEKALMGDLITKGAFRISKLRSLRYGSTKGGKPCKGQDLAYLHQP